MIIPSVVWLKCNFKTVIVICVLSFFAMFCHKEQKKKTVEDMFWENVIYMHRDKKPVVVLEVLACFGVTHPTGAK